MTEKEWLETLASMDNPAMSQIGEALVARIESYRHTVAGWRAHAALEKEAASLRARCAKMELFLGYAAVKLTGNTKEWAQGLMDRIEALDAQTRKP